MALVLGCGDSRDAHDGLRSGSSPYPNPHPCPDGDSYCRSYYSYPNAYPQPYCSFNPYPDAHADADPDPDRHPGDSE